MLLQLLVIICVHAVAFGADVEQVHLALGATPETMMAMWVTSANSASECTYNPKSDSSSVSKVAGVSETYTQPPLSHPFRSDYPAYTSGNLHSALMTGLKANTEYTYKCGDSSTDMWSPEYTFKTMPAIGDATTQVKWGILGDLGVTSDSQTTVDHLAGSDVAAILHAGDLSYANCNQPIWDTYGRMVEPVASKTGWMVGPGNHEIEWMIGDDDGSNVFKAFEARYKMPEVKPAEMGPITISALGGCTPSEFQSEYNYGLSFYSFSAGLTHVTFLNCYSTSDPQSEQYLWTKKDFSSVDRRLTPWLVVVMHCPWYNSNTAHDNEKQTVEMKDSMEQLFKDYGVNVAFQGHVHAYERTHPVFNGNLDSTATTYINIGDAGNAEGHASTYNYPTPVWSAFRNGTQYGHGVFTVYNATIASWEWNRNVDGVKVSADYTYLRR